jgi:hypothetical protein
MLAAGGRYGSSLRSRLISSPAAEAGVRQFEGRIGPLAGAAPPRDVSGMSESADIRPDALRLVEQLPADASWDDLAYEVYVRQAIAQGLADADAGRTVDHETALARARARIRRAS